MIMVILKLDEIWSAQIYVYGVERHLGILFAKEEGIAARIKVGTLYFQPLMDKYMEQFILRLIFNFHIDRFKEATKQSRNIADKGGKDNEGKFAFRKLESY